MITSAYIHIPFCEKICHYCDFTKFFYQEKMADEYLAALANEINFYLSDKKHTMRTIFVGGGTPTALNLAQLEYLLQTIDKHMDVPNVEEYTFEANPGDLNEDKIKLLRMYGVNRISMGVQSFDNQLLEDLGRLHRVKDVEENINHLIKHGLTNISIDLMYGLPNQTIEIFNDSIEKALSFDLPHYSTYSLQIEPKTVFYQRHQKGKLHKPPEEVEASMFELLIEKMKQHGKFQYEVSNFAEPGYESKHNLTYWDNNYYYGFGAGASGYLPGKRHINLRPFPAYVKEANASGQPILHIDEVGKKEQIEEEMFLGLRKRTGVNKNAFKQKYNVTIDQIYQEQIHDLIARNWLEETSDYVRMTEKGQLFGNEVFQRFLLDDQEFNDLFK
ncbi:radical SAM family heme chaperone HemW [Amphibacillus xylanus]|uniref:Heme chaperone HemW n=1 Tax=Amphibacillus xylanus (strain ATCC 51415 / DSM 6626 / JCM 7361 / LMG 17667 / NBRC 15112 / Ep01) TaxID=698758 RepID=K0IXU7_AMPXN|nr:radical SAM family heme chaperone HemW [Amphibacillus xylanus]BAM47229.1 putative oxygen-independent coproporphyrinogen III oxidase [Amphibacillus xylanus NBRC 15112]